MIDKEKEQEVWRTYPEIPFIEASNLGRIRTKDRYVKVKKQGKRLVKGHILKQQLDRYGYLYVSFRVNGELVHLKVHRAVAACFCPNPNGYPQVNHFDCDPTNNRWDNLEWCTSQYNTAYREKYGVPAKEYTKVLKRPVIAINPETSEVFYFESQREAARKLGVSDSYINMVVKGKQNKAKGYWFCYADENLVEKVRAKFGDEVAKKVEELMNENYN